MRAAKRLTSDTRVVLIGAHGSIGSFLRRQLFASGFRLTGIDVASPVIDWHCLADDITRPSETTRNELANADIVIFAVAEQVLCAALMQIQPLLQPDCLIVDTLSTKASYANLLHRLNLKQQAMGINPMFSGDLTASGRPVATVIYRDGLLVEGFMRLLETWQLEVTCLTPEQHDRTMALFQSLGHMLVLIFGEVLTHSELAPLTIKKLSPPPFRLMFSLLARMSSNHPDVYWEVQTANPYAADIRRSIYAALHQLDTTLESGARHDFDKQMKQMKSGLIDKNSAFVELSRRIFEFMNSAEVRPINNKKEEGTMHLVDFRTQIDRIDDQLVDLLGQRLAIIREVAATKKATDIPVMQPGRVEQVKERCKARGVGLGLRKEFVETLWQQIIDEACWLEYDLIKETTSSETSEMGVTTV